MQRTAQAVVSDPQILHPVPLRVTPVGGAPIASSSSSSSSSGTLPLPSSTSTSSNPMKPSLTGPDSNDDDLSSNIRHYNRTKSQQLVNNSDSLVITTDIGGGGVSRDLTDSPKHISIVTSQIGHQHRELLQNDIRPIQRPQAKKLTQKNIGALPPPPQRENPANISLPCDATTGLNDMSTLNNSINAISNKIDPPPLPPPR